MASIFSKPKPPKEKPPVVMPDMNDPAVKAAGQKQMGSLASGSGRASTLLSQGYGGGDSYGSTKLGG